MILTYAPYCVRDWMMFFDPTPNAMGAFNCFGEHVLHVQKSLKKLKGTHFIH